MKYTAHPYQTKASKWIKDKPRCGLFLDMGLGKTVSTLTAIRELIDEADICKALVVAPKTVAEGTWSTEAGKWDHLKGLRVAKVIGDEKQRLAALSQDADVYVIGRDSLKWLYGHTRGGFPFDMLVLDELTSFKNRTAVRFKVVKAFSAKAKRVVGLTGTPVPNGLLDLWAQIYCLDLGERFGKFIGKYRDQYFNAYTISRYVSKYTLKDGAERAILKKVGDICLTMQARDYLTLPSLTEIDERVALPANVMKAYKQFERDQVTRVDDVETITAANAAALLNKLSQYASGAIYDEDKNVHHVHDVKLDRLEELIEQAQSPVLVFYQFKHEATRIAERLKGYRVAHYEGERQLREWNGGELDVLLAHPASTAYGLNMQSGGHYIVWYGVGYNLEQYQQANARLHRQGQKQPVTAYRLIADGTADELALAAIDRKANTQNTVINVLKQLVRQYER